MRLSRWVVSIILAGSLTLATGAASGQAYPSKPIRIITGGAGSGNDFTARQIVQGISGPLGQPVIVDNRTGPLATEAVWKAPADGYTVLVIGGALWIRPLLEKVGYDALRDFSPITLTEKTTNIVAVHPSLPVKSVKDLIALARARPGELNFGSTAPGSSNHLAAVLFKSMAGIDIVGVPYKSSSPVITALIGGEVQLAIIDVGLVLPHVKTGRLKALAITSMEPSPLAPGLPTVAASGLPGYESVSLVGVLVPVKTPAPIINRLNQEIVRVLNMAEVKERFLNAGIEVVTSTPEEFAATIKSDFAKWSKVIRDAGVKS